MFLFINKLPHFYFLSTNIDAFQFLSCMVIGFESGPKLIELRDIYWVSRMALLYLRPSMKEPPLKEPHLKTPHQKMPPCKTAPYSKLPVCERSDFYNMEAHHLVGWMLYYCLNHSGLV